MTNPDRYGDREPWQDPRGLDQRGGYSPGPGGYAQGPYRPDPPGPYQHDPRAAAYPQGPYRQDPRAGTYPQGPYQQDPRAGAYPREPQTQVYPPGPYQHDPRTQAYPPSGDLRPGPEPERYGGADGNERLTVMTGAVLLILLATEGLTILSIGRLLTLHFFLGMLLLGPVLLKAGSVIYRFYRYYTGSAPYRRKGPPAPLLRLLGPFLILLTAGVFGSGVMLALVGPSGRSPWLTVHKAAFILWFAAMAIHVIAYVPRLPRLLYAEARGEALPENDGRGHAAGGRQYTRAARVLGGRGVRLSLLAASLLAGLVIALASVHLAGAWEIPGRFFHG